MVTGPWVGPEQQQDCLESGQGGDKSLQLISCSELFPGVWGVDREAQWALPPAVEREGVCPALGPHLGPLRGVWLHLLENSPGVVGGVSPAGRLEARRGVVRVEGGEGQSLGPPGVQASHLASVGDRF